MGERLNCVVTMNDGKSALCDSNTEQLELFTSGVAGCDVSAVILRARNGRKFGGLTHFATNLGEEHTRRLKEILEEAVDFDWNFKRLHVFVAENNWEQDEITTRLGLLVQAVQTKLGDDVRVGISRYPMSYANGVSRGGHGEISLRVVPRIRQSISFCWKDGSGM